MIKLGKKVLEIPVIQGGMGVGVSLSGLAGHVALCGGMGTISSVNAGYRERDFIRHPLEANLRALRREIRRAREIAGGRGMIAVNIMCAVTHYAETCRCAVEAGADVILSGAGLPLKLPEYTAGTDTLCAPIVSSGRAAGLLIRSYLKHYGVKPDFLVVEGRAAGGHLGFSEKELSGHTAKDNLTLLEEVRKQAGDIPVFVGGGVFDAADRRELMRHGASGVQLGTRFIATHECDAHPGFKQAVIEASAEDIVLIKSPVGMPARAINSPLLKRLAAGGRFAAETCSNCLSACPKGDRIPYCISRALIEAVKGNWETGLFFAGSNAERVREIISVRELMDQLMEE